MPKGSRLLDKELYDVLKPLGFKKIPKTRHYIRLIGEGIFQMTGWDAHPRSHQMILFSISSVYKYNAFELPLMCNRGFIMPPYGVDDYCNTFLGTNMLFGTKDENEEFDLFLKYVIPYMSDCDTLRKVYDHSRIMIFQKNKYNFAQELNLSLYLREFDEAELYIEKGLEYLIETRERKVNDFEKIKDAILSSSYSEELKTELISFLKRLKR